MEYKPIYWILLACLFTACQSSNNSILNPRDLNGVIQKNADGLLPSGLHFSWTVDRNLQGSYQILVARSEDLLKNDIGDIWDSERRFGPDSAIGISDNGLLGVSKVWWKIRLWTTDGIPGDFSKVHAINLPESQAPINITLIGGTLINEMENNGYLESAIGRLFPNNDIIFRNIGWPADDVFGQQDHSLALLRILDPGNLPQQKKGLVRKF
ncbi:MAG: hypothetical protein IPL46_27985 [Saprospiraceae bacterium]|nr:hypothetical protein [Saprospiraceae bacterium]